MFKKLNQIFIDIENYIYLNDSQCLGNNLILLSLMILTIKMEWRIEYGLST